MGLGWDLMPPRDVRRAVRAGAIITIASVFCTIFPVWVWLQIDPVIRVRDIYISCVVLPVLIAPTSSFFILRAQIRAQRLAQENHRLANHDELTGLPNRRAFFAQAGALLSRSRRSTDIFACAIADIDFFKRINDTHGHDTGDRVLKALAAALTDLSSDNTVLARLGGEEFAVAGMFASEAAARIWFEALVREVEHRHPADLPVTISLGWCEAETGETLSSQLSRADHALYEAKSRGKNRAVKTPPAGSCMVAVA
jgi:diguanylate cyclase (GGDEF)-like protein